ncbi:MAG: hypothetical protein WCK51_11795 [Armatimonadota bacterium]
MSEKLFSESEVAEIIRRAGELQEEKSVEGYVPGVAAHELMQLAQEVGIRPEYLELALRERQEKAAPATKNADRIERVIPVEIDPDDYDVITDGLRLIPASSVNGTTSGGISQFGRTMLGQVRESWDNPHFKLSSRGGRTKIEVWTDKSAALGISFLWMMPLIFSAGAFKVGGIVAGFVALFLVIGAAVATYRGMLQKSAQAVLKVADRLEQSILEYGEGSDLRANLSSSIQIIAEPSEQRDATSE